MPSFMDKLTVNGEEMDMYAAIPSGSGPFPAVVIAFHVGGMDEFDKVMADRFAEEGYVAFTLLIPTRFRPLFHRLFSEEVMADRFAEEGYVPDWTVLVKRLWPVPDWTAWAISAMRTSSRI